MLSFVLVVFALALLAAVIALSRAIRLRKALEKLLHILLSRWRHHGMQNKDYPPNPAADSVTTPDTRLR